MNPIHANDAMLISLENPERFNASNHLSQHLPELSKLLGVKYDPEYRDESSSGKAVTRKISKWYNTLLETEDGFWIPAIEFFFLESLGMETIQQMGYMEGRMHHLGWVASAGMQSASLYKGYEMWVEYN